MIYYTQLPKIGGKGIAIESRHQTTDWEFDSLVARWMTKYDIPEAWFQTFDRNGWKWVHGIVKLENGNAVITQVG